ncbi:MAG: PilN domain-containing protein [Bdellovibrionota bacterium]
MAGVNLLKQIRDEEVVEQTAVASVGGALSEISSLDKIRLGLFGVGFLALFLIRGYVADTYLPAKLEAPNAEIAELAAKLTATNAKKAQLSELEKELKENETRITELKTKIGVINRIKNSNRDKVVRMTDYIVTQMPDPIWISELQVEAKSGSVVDFKGYSMNHQTISTFFSKLENGVFFSKWELVEATREKVKDAANHDFEASKFELKAQVSEVP